MPEPIYKFSAKKWASLNLVLPAGEVGKESDTGRTKTGTGTTAWNALAYDPGTDDRAALPVPTYERIAPGNSTAASAVGCVVATQGTISNPAPSTTNDSTRRRRLLLTTAGTAGAMAEVRSSVLAFFASTSTGQGGYRAVLRFAVDTLVAGTRAFLGLESSVAAATNADPASGTATAKVGIALVDSSANWSIVTSNTGFTPTVIDLGSGFAAVSGERIEAVFTVDPETLTVRYTVANLSTGARASGSVTSNTPSASRYLGHRAWVTNNATLSPAALALELDDVLAA